MELGTVVEQPNAPEDGAVLAMWPDGKTAHVADPTIKEWAEIGQKGGSKNELFKMRAEDGKVITLSWRACRQPLIALYVRSSLAPRGGRQKCGAPLSKFPGGQDAAKKTFITMAQELHDGKTTESGL